ncbi:MAG: prepilin-type N-terminal cleavage/methylation domain-containing protein [Desulfovermiculus sp.]
MSKPNEERLAGTILWGGDSGFTLLEMIISLTILSLVVLTVYVAFSLGVDVWKGMDKEKSAAERKAMTLRLLQEDLARIRPYTWNSEKGDVLFFAGGPTSVFYVTTHGLGAKNRSGKALFFTCLYVHSAPEGEGNSLYVYKSGLPKPEIMEAVRDFRAGTEMERTNYVPPGFITEEGVPVLHNVQGAQFGYQEQAYPIFSQVKAQVEGDWDQERDTGDILANTEWVRDELPGQISFTTNKDTENGFIARAVLTDSPTLDHKKR